MDRTATIIAEDRTLTAVLLNRCLMQQQLADEATIRRRLRVRMLIRAGKFAAIGATVVGATVTALFFMPGMPRVDLPLRPTSLFSHAASASAVPSIPHSPAPQTVINPPVIAAPGSSSVVDPDQSLSLRMQDQISSIQPNISRTSGVTP